MKTSAVIVLFLLFISALLLTSQWKETKKNQFQGSYLDRIQDRPIILCHRGSRYMGLENTIQMFHWALKMGCDALEFDVRLTKDDKLVIFHDDQVDRLMDTTGNVRDFTYQELSQMDLGYRYSPDGGKTFPFRGLKKHSIPLLDDVLTTFRGTNMNIEIKENEPIVAEMLWTKLQANLRARDIQNVIVASRWCEVLQHFREITQGKVATSACEKEAMTFLLSSMFGLHKWIYAYTDPAPVVYQIPTTSSGIRFVDSKYIQAAHDLGQKLMFWVINREEDMKQLFDIYVDGIVTDRPDIAHQLQHKTELVDDNKIQAISRDFINSTQGFFIPEYNPDEIHQCVSIACHILPWILNYLPFWVLLIVLIGLRLVFGSKKLKKA